MDLVIFGSATCDIILFGTHLDECSLIFQLWSYLVLAFNFISLVVDGFSYHQIKQRYLRVGLARTSLVLDIALLSLACLGPIMISEAVTCSAFVQVKAPIAVLSVFMFIRVFHMVLMILYIIFVLPCYCCNDSCFIKRHLVAKVGVSKAVLGQIERSAWKFSSARQLSSHMSCTLTAIAQTLSDISEDAVSSQLEDSTRKMESVSTCFICLSKFEAGVKIVLLPCKTLFQLGSSLKISTLKYSMLDQKDDDDLALLQCSHIFHLDCLLEWLKREI